MPAEPRDYAEVIAEGAATVGRPPLWHPTRWVAGVMLTVDVLAGRRRIHVHEPDHYTDDDHEPYGTASVDDIDDQEAEDIRRTDQARAIALAENTYYGGIS